MIRMMVLTAMLAVVACSALAVGVGSSGLQGPGDTLYRVLPEPVCAANRDVCPAWARQSLDGTKVIAQWALTSTMPPAFEPYPPTLDWWGVQDLFVSCGEWEGCGPPD